MMARMPPELEPSSEEMRALVSRAMDRIVAYVEGLPTEPVSSKAHSAELARSLAAHIPEDGVGFDQILSTVFDRAITQGHNGASPGFMAYIPGGGLFAAAVADLVSRSINRFTGVWDASPGLIQLESNVIRWFCDTVVGYPPTSGGILTSGGSMAHFSAIVAARRERLPEDFLSGTLYASEE